MLSLQYRPKTLDDVVGQKSVSLVLKMMAVKQVIPSTLLFDGASGSGKTSTARVISSILNCYLNDGNSCGKCSSCTSIREGSSLAVTEIDASTNGLVADMRKLRERVYYASPGRVSVYIIDEAHAMSKDAFNALLKVLEETPPNVVFILVTTEAIKIPVTIQSRCIRFTFNRIAKSDISSRLKSICNSENMLTVESQLLEKLAEESNGSMRDAINSLDRLTSVGIVTYEQYSEIISETDFAPVLMLALMQNNLPLAYSILDRELANCGDPTAVWRQIVAAVRDVMVIDSGGSVARQGAALEQRQKLASLLSPGRMFAAMKVLWDFKTKIRVEDMHASFNIACVLLAEALRGKDTAVSSSRPVRSNTDRVSLNQIQSMIGSS